MRSESGGNLNQEASNKSQGSDPKQTTSIARTAVHSVRRRPSGKEGFYLCSRRSENEPRTHCTSLPPIKWVSFPRSVATPNIHYDVWSVSHLAGNRTCQQ